MQIDSMFLREMCVYNFYVQKKIFHLQPFVLICLLELNTSLLCGALQTALRLPGE